MFNELTEKQWEQIDQAYEEGLAKGMSTEPADRPAAEAAISGLYKEAGLTPPRYVWALDQQEMKRALALIYRGVSSWGEMSESGVTETVAEKWHDGCGGEWLADAQRRAADMVRGSGQAHWVQHYSAMRDIVGVKYSERDDRHLRTWDDLVKSCGWWAPYEEWCMISERPLEIHVDEQGNLHREDGPAYVGRGQFRHYAWRGEAIPGEWIENPESIDAEVLFSWPNMDQRAAAAEIVGWPKILTMVEAELIDQNKDPQIGSLYRVKMPGLSNPVHVHMFECGTGRTMGSPVPNTIKTAMEAEEVSYEMQQGQYAPEFRT